MRRLGAMAAEREHRRHPRARIKCPVVMSVSKTLIDGETKNLSLGGAFIKCAEQPKPGLIFRMTIEPSKGRLFLVSAEVVWSDSYTVKDKTVLRGLGVRFLEILDGRQFLRNEIERHVKGKISYLLGNS
ncbi:MAG TPA: PilZ domain-containing protein [Syntrophobacteria bacterium]|nr:PilZ domain-containing protein [Syntrophobacteria bacterium]